jgi:hypothetical protein
LPPGCTGVSRARCTTRLASQRTSDAFQVSSRRPGAARRRGRLWGSPRRTLHPTFRGLCPRVTSRPGAAQAVTAGNRRTPARSLRSVISVLILVRSLLAVLLLRVLNRGRWRKCSVSARTDVAPALHADAIAKQASLSTARIVDTSLSRGVASATELFFRSPKPMGPLVGHQRNLSLPTSACEKGNVGVRTLDNVVLAYPPNDHSSIG